MDLITEKALRLLQNIFSFEKINEKNFTIRERI